MKQKLILILNFFLFQSAQASVLSLESTIRNAWTQSPQMSAAEEQASLASFDRFRRYIPNEPSLSYGSTDDDTARSFGLQLTTAFPGKTFALSKLDSARSRSAQAELQSKKYDLARTYAQAYLDCAGAAESLELQKITSSDLETVFASLKTLYEAGHSTQAEKIGAELQSRQAKLDLVTAEDRKTVACQKFRNLLEMNQSGDSEAELKLPDDIDANLIHELSGETSDISRSKAAFDLAQTTSDIAYWSELPDITFGINRNHYLYQPGSPNGKNWTTSYNVSVTFPLLFPFYETVEARRTRSQAVIDQNAALIQNVAARSDQKDGAREYRRDKERLLELRRKDLALGEALVESTYSAYRSGKLGYAELVLSRKTLNDLRLQDIQLRTSIINAHLRCLNNCESNEAKL